MTHSAWPSLSLDAWRDSYVTLHMCTQVVGKVCLALAPPANHFWNVAFHVTPRGLSTRTLPYGDRAIDFAFDFIDHRVIARCTDGSAWSIPLTARPVAEFHDDVMQVLRELGMGVHIWRMPVEVPDPVPFDRDIVHASYDAAYVNRFWRILVSIDRVFQDFRARFCGKCSPVHFFWGSFDLAVTRFSGRRAPERAGADAITREAYSHEVISHGFWPGGQAVQTPAFYAYAAPEPAGFRETAVAPPGAFYNAELSEFILPYEEVRLAKAPEHVLTEFLESTYDAGARCASWDRSELERKTVLTCQPLPATTSNRSPP